MHRTEEEKEDKLDSEQTLILVSSATKIKR